MKALSVQQPWAWAIIHGGKGVENRTRKLAGTYRGPVAIHAGKRIDKAGVAIVAELSMPPLFPWPTDVNPTAVLGAIIGVVNLVNEHPSPTGARCCGEWAEPGAVHLVVREPVALPEPVPCRGALGLWTVPDDVEIQVALQIAEAVR